MGTVNERVWSSSANLALSRKSSVWRITSWSTSSTKTWKGSAVPWILGSNAKSGVIVSSTRSTVRVIGCTCAASSSRGNWWTKRWIALPIFGKRISSPISCGCRS